ncbi:MAG: Two-component transcriptional response regulator, LuxR family, partial [uncultured Friedmanniella sp.]
GAGHRAARDERLRRAGGAARAGLDPARHHPHRAGLGHRHRRRPGRRRGRLHGQALPLRGAAGPGPDPAAGQRGDAVDRPQPRGAVPRRADTHRLGGRRAGGALGARVRAARDVPAAPRPGAQPGAAAVPGVGLRLRPGLQRRGRVRALRAQQDRQPGDRDRPRRRLPARPL